MRGKEWDYKVPIIFLYFIIIIPILFVSFYLIIYNTLYSYQWFKNNVKLQTNDRVVVNGESGEIAFKNLT